MWVWIWKSINKTSAFFSSIKNRSDRSADIDIANDMNKAKQNTEDMKNETTETQNALKTNIGVLADVGYFPLNNIKNVKENTFELKSIELISLNPDKTKWNGQNPSILKGAIFYTNKNNEDKKIMFKIEMPAILLRYNYIRSWLFDLFSNRKSLNFEYGGYKIEYKKVGEAYELDFNLDPKNKFWQDNPQLYDGLIAHINQYGK